jgi:GH24 family phage-related lysozyme (muramidase)/Skp family chaperone for outer membrane proteins
MSSRDPEPARASDSLERERWEAECAFRDREVAVKERELQHKTDELAHERAKQETSRWTNPLVIAVAAAAVAAMGNAFVSYQNDLAQRNLQATQGEQARILAMIQTPNPDQAATNLKFLLDSGLVTDSGTTARLRSYLKDRKPGQGAALPTVSALSPAAKIALQFEPGRLKPYHQGGATFIGHDHLVSYGIVHSGTLVIGGKRVHWSDQRGITKRQADQLLSQDIAATLPIIRPLVHVHLTDNQWQALADFGYNVGASGIQTTVDLINRGQLDRVPAEMKRWVHAGSGVSPELVKRRDADIALWNTP